MLTVSAIKSASGASDYFLTKAEEYYDEGFMPSFWVGRLQDSLNISGEVDGDTFRNLLDGALPSGKQMGRKTSEGVKHRPGYELCFTAPKSVSIMALCGRDSRIIECFTEAVKRTFTVIEETYAASRVMKNGELQTVKTDNLVAACFLHPTSRSGEPNLHAHSLMMNMTQTLDGKIRALYTNRYDSKGLTGGEALFRHNKLLGLIFRNELACLLKENTEYEIVNDNNGSFEIAGVPKTLCDAYSSRRKEILSKQEEMGNFSAKAALAANYITRNRKEMSLNEAKSLWENVNQNQKFEPGQVFGHPEHPGRLEKDIETVAHKPANSFFLNLSKKLRNYVSQAGTDSQILSKKDLAERIVAAAEAHCLSINGSFNVTDIMREATLRAFSELSSQDLVLALSSRMKNEWQMTQSGEYTTCLLYTSDAADE